MCIRDSSFTLPTSTPFIMSTPSRAFHLQPFFVNNPELWFDLAESALLTIEDEKERYSRVVNALPESCLLKIRDGLATTRNSTTPYNTLKTLIIDRLAPTREEQLETLLGGISLGDQKPSELMVGMLGLLGGTPSTREEKIIRTLFLQKMPARHHSVLQSINPTLSLTEFAATADRILRPPMEPLVHTSYAVSSLSPTSSTLAPPQPSTTHAQHIPQYSTNTSATLPPPLVPQPPSAAYPAQPPYSHPHHPSYSCLLYTSDAADERSSVDLGGRRIIKKKKKKLTTP